MPFISVVLCLAMTLSFALSTAANAGGCDPREILQKNIKAYDRSTSTWISYVDEITSNINVNEDDNLGIKYNGFNLTLGDAQTLSNLYKRNTNYQLTHSDRVSFLSSELSPDSVRAYIECIKSAKTDITVVAPNGVENLQRFPITVFWHPTYNVQVRKGSTDRPVEISVSNGFSAKSNKKISPNGSIPFDITREDIDKPINITATIDGRTSDYLTFPPQNLSIMVLTLKKNDHGPIRRSLHYGDAEVGVDMCIEPDNVGGVLLPSTARVDVTGAGYQWAQRSSITPRQGNHPLQVCARLWTAGVPCGEESCYHEATGHLSVVHAYISQPTPRTLLDEQEQRFQATQQH